MASIDLRRTLKTSAGILVFLTAAVPRDAVLQLTSESAAEHQRQLVERIEDEQARHGTYSERLIEPLQALALLHQEAGDRALAVATIERARQVVRANYGLQSLEHAPLIRQQIALEQRASYGSPTGIYSIRTTARHSDNTSWRTGCSRTPRKHKL